MFRNILFALILATFGLSLAGCGDTRESIAEESVSKMKKLTAILQDVKDEASAKTGAEKMAALADEMKDLQARMKKLGDPTADEKKKMEEKYKKDMEEAMGGMMKEMMRIGSDPKLSGPMEQAMKKFEGSMSH